MFARQLYNFHNIFMTACKDKKPCFYKEAAIKKIKIIINNTIDILKINIYDHESYGCCFQPGWFWFAGCFWCSRRTLGRITLHKARPSGVGCVGSIKTTFGQSQSPHPFRLDWWASGGISNAFLHRCPLLPLRALEVMKKSCILG